MTKKFKKKAEQSETERMLADQLTVVDGVLKQAKACGVKGDNKAWVRSLVGVMEPAPVANGMMIDARLQIADALVERLERTANEGQEAAIIHARDQRWGTSTETALLDRRQAAKDFRPIAKRLAPSCIMVLHAAVLQESGDQSVPFGFGWRGLLWGPNLHDEIEGRVRAQGRAMQPIGTAPPISFERIENSRSGWERAARVLWSFSPEAFGLEDEIAVEEASAFRLAMLLGSTQLQRLTLGIGEGEEVLRSLSRLNKAWAAGQGSWDKTLAHPDRIPRDMARVMNTAGFGEPYALPYVRLR